jgi:hypothetical protein
VGQLSLTDGFRCEGEKEGQTANTLELGQQVLFNHIAPDLLGNRSIGKLIVYVWKWMHVPNLECNNWWVKDSLCKVFEVHDARVVLSDHTKDGRRVLSVAKYFKNMGHKV